MLLFFTMLLVASIFMRFTYVEQKMKRPPFVISAEKDVCFSKSETVCDTPQTASFYFWNLTNPFEVISGAAPPKLKEVGPYVMHNAKEKKSNITFFENNTKVSYVSTSYADWKVDAFCANCTLADHIVSVNPAYLTLVRLYGSEMNFIHSLTPRVLPGVLAGISAVLKGLAEMPTMAAAMPHVKAAADAGDAALYALAVQQWGDCSVLGGKSVRSLPLPPATLAKFPVVPEFGAYAAAKAGLNDTSVLGLSAAAAKVVVEALTADPSGVGVLTYLQYPVPVLATTLKISGKEKCVHDMDCTFVKVLP